MQNFDNFGIMLDCSRNAVMKPTAVKEMIDMISAMGYNFLMLYTEDTYEVNNEPYFGHMRGRYSKEELKELDSYAASRGMTLMPCIQTLAHLNGLMQWKRYDEIKDCHDILCAGEERVYELIDSMFASLAESFTCRTVNIGMDEANFIGRGKYMDKNGKRKSLDILLEHLRRVSEIAGKYGFSLLMWGDMFFSLANGGKYYDGSAPGDEIKKQIPDNVTLIYWDYYSDDKSHYDRMITAHQAIQPDIWFAGGIWTWTGFAPHNDRTLRASRAAFESCREKGVKNVIMTMWGDDGAECSRYSALPAIYAAAQYAKGNYDDELIKAGFEEMFGISYSDFMLTGLSGTPNSENINNPEKYMLYNDCFMGLLDSAADPNSGASYAACAEKLGKLCSEPRFGYIFRTLKSLCDTIALKYDIGLRVRRAYAENNKAELEKIVSDYKALLTLIDKFYNAFEEQWMRENKPHGFDVQDIRIGGLERRIRHCIGRLESYMSGELDRIEELEEPVLDRFCESEPAYKPCCFNNWAENASANVVCCPKY